MTIDLHFAKEALETGGSVLNLVKVLQTLRQWLKFRNKPKALPPRQKPRPRPYRKRWIRKMGPDWLRPRR